MDTLNFSMRLKRPAAYQISLDELARSLMADSVAKDRKSIGSTINRLADACAERFAIEEDEMRRTGYPGYLGHKSSHDAFLASLRQIASIHSAGEFAMTDGLDSAINEWLTAHSATEDRRFEVDPNFRTAGDKRVPLL